MRLSGAKPGIHNKRANINIDININDNKSQYNSFYKPHRNTKYDDTDHEADENGGATV